MATKVSRAYVTGRGIFPEDMLRYDQCYPVDGRLWNEGVGDVRTIEIAQVHDADEGPNWTPTRWESFLWSLSFTDPR